MQKILKIQQNTAKHRKMSTTYYDITYDETLLRDLDNQPKRLAKNRNMSSSTTSSSDGYNEEDLANKQKDHSTTSDSVEQLCNLLAMCILLLNFHLLYIQ